MSKATTPILVLAALIAAALVALMLVDDDNGPSLVAPPATIETPSATTSSAPPSATPTRAVPTMEPTSGTLVYLRGNDLWVAPLDGSSPPHQLSSNGRGAGYAGYVPRSDGGIDVYYSVQEGEPEHRRGATFASFALFRVDLETGHAVQIRRFDSRPSIGYSVRFNAAISPDGGHLAFTDEFGVALLNVASDETRRLLSNGACERGIEDCFGYHEPTWSPTGRMLSLKKILWEGSVTALVNPFVDPINVFVLPDGGGWDVSWSPSGSTFCVTGLPYGGGRGQILLGDATSGEAEDVTMALPGVSDEPSESPSIVPLGCSFLTDGQLVAAYTTADSDRTQLAFFNEDTEVIGTPAVLGGRIQLVNVLPNGTDLLMSTGVYDLGRGLVAFPFEVDQALAVIP